MGKVEGSKEKIGSKHIMLAEAAVLKAAMLWWRGRRPLNYTRAKHLKNPAVNTVGDAEHVLAEAVAAFVDVMKAVYPGFKVP